MKTLTSMVRLGAVVAALLPGAVLAQGITMKFGTASINDPQTEFMKLYKEDLERRTDGKIKVELYPQSQLGPIPRQIEGLQLGTIEAFIGPADFFVGSDPRFGVFSVPALFKTNDNAARTISDPELNKTIRELGTEKGLVGVAAFFLGVSNYTAKSPILKLADFSGKKIRVNGTALDREKMRRLGATAVPLPLGDVLPSLQRGTIDGTMSITAVFVSFKFNELVDTMTVTDDTMLVTLAMVGKVWFDKLPANLQKDVVDAGQAVQPKVVAWEKQYAKDMEAKWLQVGAKIHRFPADEQAKMDALIKTVGDEVTAGQPAVSALLGKVRAVAAKY